MAKKRRSGVESHGLLGRVAEDIGASLGNVLNQIEKQVRNAKQQRDATVQSLLAVRQKATSLLADLGHGVTDASSSKKRGRPRGSGTTASKNAQPPKRKSGISAAGRAAIARAQKERWAKIKAAKKKEERAVKD